MFFIVNALVGSKIFRYNIFAHISTRTFFCYSVNLSANEGMLKFIMVHPSERGKAILSRIKEYKAADNKKRIFAPKKITECIACPKYKGCLTDFVLSIS